MADYIVTILAGAPGIKNQGWCPGGVLEACVGFSTSEQGGQTKRDNVHTNVLFFPLNSALKGLCNIKIQKSNK